MNFVVSPRAVPHLDIVTGIEKFAHESRGNSAWKELIHYTIDVLNNAYKTKCRPKANLSLQERDALKNLKNNHDIIIILADKGNSTVILSRTDYEKKLTTLLCDPCYIELKKDKTASIQRKVSVLLNRLLSAKEITDSQKRKWLLTDPNCLQMYGLFTRAYGLAVSCAPAPVTARCRMQRCILSLCVDVMRYVQQLTQ